MFESWGRRVYAWRWGTLATSAVFLLLSAVVLARGGTLTSGTIRGIEADTAARLVNAECRHAEGAGFTVIFHSERLTTDDAAFHEAVRAAMAPVRRDPHVVAVSTPFDDDVSMLYASTLISLDTHRALALVTLDDAALDNTTVFPGIAAKIRAGAGLDVTITGVAAFRSDLDAVLQHDLVRAEVLSAPITLFVLLLVFGSVVAALLPAGVGGLAVACGVAAVLLLSRLTDVAQYAINVVSLVGLGVAIDYSLFIVSRYRDELDRGASIPDALAIAVSTAGRAVAFSGLAVAIGLSGLLFFHGSYLASLGLGGTVVVALSVVYALTFLPALLAVIGPHITRGQLLPKRLRVGRGFWRVVATAVMRRPVLVLIPTLAVLVGVGQPFRSIQVAIPDIHVLPEHTPARRGDAILREFFPERVATRIAIVVRFPDAPLSRADRVGALYDASRRLAAIPGVDHVESLFDSDPFLDRAGYQAALAGGRDALSEGLRTAYDHSIGAHIAILAAVTDAEPASAQARAIVQAVRATRAVADGDVLVTGQTAMDLDSAAYMRRYAPRAALWVVVMTMLVLFALLGSVVLPLKAVVMNLLSITGSFGALVWIFQQGHFHTFLRFTPGPIDPSLPIVMFCATFGLSMDYEVLLLTRMQEEYLVSRDNTRAVAEGLERSGKLITSAAAIMVVVFAAFVTTEIVLLKAIGLGMAIAVTLDATIVRILVVPATMRLFGDLNWWAPGPLARFQQRLRGKGGH